MSNLSSFHNQIKGRKVDVIGIGISNRPLIAHLADHGAQVTACDRRTREELGEDVYRELANKGVQFSLGDTYLNSLEGDIIFKTPGMRFDVPQLVEARKRGAQVTSEMEVFFQVCPANIIAVTGSDGKTTTTTLIYNMLKQEGYKTWVGGNIGTPLLIQADAIGKDDWVVLELSSFQLHTMRQSAQTAVITNISPNHLDMHKDYQEYIDAKKNIYLYQKEGDRLILNYDNDVTREIGKERPCIYFSKTNEQAPVHLKDGWIVRNGAPVLAVQDIKIPGMHNVENYMTAIAAVGDLVSVDTIRSVAKNFGGVEHRIEYVRTVGGVKYYNSSIDSSPNRTMNTLKVFPKKVILIAGGKDKGIPYDGIGAPIAEHVKGLVLIGATADKIEEAVYHVYKSQGRECDIPVLRANTYEEAVGAARSLAKEGDTVILSPASTSFDMFKNFEERGKLFKKIVNRL